MADKTYKMTVTLSDGNTVDAGTFVAPQGPAGELGNWSSEKRTTDNIFKAGDGTYLYHLKQVDNFGGSNTDAIGIIEIKDGKGTSTCTTTVYNLPEGDITSYKAGIRYDTIVVDGPGYISTIYSYYLPYRFDQSTGDVNGLQAPKLANQFSFGEEWSTIKVLKIA